MLEKTDPISTETEPSPEDLAAEFLGLPRGAPRGSPDPSAPSVCVGWGGPAGWADPHGDARDSTGRHYREPMALAPTWASSATEIAGQIHPSRGASSGL